MSHRPNHNTGSSTCVVDPIELQDVSQYLPQPQHANTNTSFNPPAPSSPPKGLRLSDTKPSGVGDDVDDDSPVDLPSPTTQAAQQPERWNQSRTNLYRTVAAFWSFVVMGSNDAAYGALIPYVCIFVHVRFSGISINPRPVLLRFNPTSLSPF